MIRQALFGGLMAKILLAMVALAIWQNYNGDPTAIVAQGWDILEGGARIVTNLWDNFSHSTAKK